MRKPATYPTAVFRERFEYLQERDGMTLSDVAALLGWYSKQAKFADNTRVARVLGIRPYRSGPNTTPLYRQEVDYELAVKLCDALALDYHEVGV